QMNSMKKPVLFLGTFWLVLLTFMVTALARDLPQGFVYVDNYIPDVVVELRYLTHDNFLGEPVDGYVSARPILTRQATQALKGVQEDLKPFGLGIKIFDAYRPQRAVDHFVRWAKDLSDTKMKAQYYPDVDKKDLFKKGYIADQSSHSRGSTVDLTLVDRAPGGVGRDLNMGSGFDFFGPVSWPTNLSIDASARAHRMLLQRLMMDHGFEPYAQEWWHFTLKDEPYPDTYFDFPVR
ncbi:MAG: M15 family metallopeptidase, partial [Desulfobacteraceae bacterium]